MSIRDEHTRLLKILEGHGQSFLDSFSMFEEKKRKGTPDDSPTPTKKRKVEEPSSDEHEEWFGINTLGFGDHSVDEEASDRSGSGKSRTYNALYRHYSNLP